MQLTFKKITKNYIEMEVIELTKEIWAMIAMNGKCCIKIASFILEVSTDKIGECGEYETPVYFLLKGLFSYSKEKHFRAEIGDYLLKDAIGDLHVCKPDMFKPHYEKTIKNYQ